MTLKQEIQNIVTKRKQVLKDGLQLLADPRVPEETKDKLIELILSL